MGKIVVKARAPSRIGIGGGGSDLPSFFEQHGGAVLNVAINMYSYTKLTKNGVKNTRVVSHDWEIEREIEDLKLEFDLNKKNNVDVVKAAMCAAEVSPKEGYELVIHSMSPKNSGLAGSSALIVSLLAAMFNVSGKPMMNRDKFAKTAYHVEREVLKRPGGYQDQYAAVFGGFNFIEFGKNSINISPLRLEEDLVSEWHSSMMLFETPFPRLGFAHDVEKGKDDAFRKGGESVEYMKKIKEHAYGMRDALICGDVRELGELLHLSWMEKKKLPGVSSADIDMLYEVARENGAYGGKLCGAGGGGFLFVVCDMADRKKIANALVRKGAKFANFDYDFEGMVSWRTEY
ncbi:Galactokinase [Candidatus Anstonella stagnisolia]|nr:Galactokinase [Candidatus Anstonella stagnisolia]